MDTLSELVRIVTPRLRERVPVISRNWTANSEGKTTALLKELNERNGLTDQQAIKKLYGLTGSPTKFRTLKSRLKERLINSIFFLELAPRVHAERTIALYTCNRGRFLVSTLFAFGARRVAERLAEQTLRVSDYHQFTIISLELLQTLRGHYAREGNKRKFREYSERARDTIRLLEAENMAAEQYEKYAVEFAQSSSARPDLVEYTTSAAQTLDNLRSEFPSYSILLSYYRMSNMATSVAGNFLATTQTCQEACRYLATVPHISTSGRIGEFLIDELESYIFLRQYSDGERVAARCQQELAEGKNNWFIFMENYFLFAMHTKHFEQALELFKRVTSHTRFDLLSPHRKEKWRIFELYLVYLFPNEPLVSYRGSLKKRRLILKDFLRQVPTYAHDKRGYNVAILIVQILFLLDQQDFDGIINRVEALKTYRSRYLRSSGQRQSALFFRMLQVMVQKSFKRAEVEKAASKALIDLNFSTAQYEEITEALQILPFDWVWKRMLEKLL
jgi:hypothetical protein